MKIVIIPDVHGTIHWEKIKNSVDKYNKIIFLGDYCDGYLDENDEPIPREKEIENLKNIIKFKNDCKDKVILLMGNHDLNQYILNEPLSRKARNPYFIEIQKIFNENIHLFEMVYKVGEYVCSHAGISKTWMEINNIKDLEDINVKFHQKLYELFGWHGLDMYGNDRTQGCTWIRPESLFVDMAFPKQIVGHTKVLKAPFKVVNDKIDDLKGKEIIMLDSEKQDCIYEIES